MDAAAARQARARLNPNNYGKRHVREGLCITCKEPIAYEFSSVHCERHYWYCINRYNAR